MKFPTWEEAAAAVFSGNSTEESSDIWATPAATTSTTTWTPHSELEHATTTPRQPAKKQSRLTSQFSLKIQSADKTSVLTVPLSPTSTISGHHHPSHPEYTRHNTTTKHPNINLSPIHTLTNSHVNTTFECFHTSNTNQDTYHQPFISIMNDTYLVKHNN